LGTRHSHNKIKNVWANFKLCDVGYYIFRCPEIEAQLLYSYAYTIMDIAPMADAIKGSGSLNQLWT